MAKVRIVSNPKNPDIKPLYQQDKNSYALDTSIIKYGVMDKKQDLDDDVNTTIGPAKDGKGTIEAEKGENLVTPGLENYAIGGKTHAQGGTPLDAEPGSFIFSNYRKLLLKGIELAEFGIKPNSAKARKGMTPAEVAKMYPTNKFLQLLRDDDTDKATKETASLMLDNMSKKLGKLALLQESKKGFPNGIPQIAMPLFGEQGDDEQGGGRPQMKKGGQVKYQRGGRTPALRIPTTIDDRIIPGVTVPANYNTPSAPPANVNYGFDTDPQTYENPYKDTGYGKMDFVNMSAPFLTPLRKYMPVRQHIEAEQLNYNPIDLSANRQAIRGQIKTQQDTQSIYNPRGNAANSAAFGQGADAINNSFQTEFNANQEGSQRVSAMNAEARQQVKGQNAGFNDQYNSRVAQTNENFDAEKRARLSQFLKSWGVAEGQRQYRNAMNMINRDFNVTADGQIIRKKYSQDQMLARAFGNTGSVSGGNRDLFDLMGQLRDEARNKGLTLTDGELLTTARQMMNFDNPTYRVTDKNNDQRIDQVQEITKRNPLFMQWMSQLNKGTGDPYGFGY